MSGHIIPKDAPQIPVPERLTKPHPLVKKLKDAARPLEKNDYGWPIARRGLVPLDVSKPHLGRALRIMQALITEAEARGYRVAESPQNQRGDSTVVFTLPGETFTIRIKEKEGKLTLSLPNTYHGQGNWSDGKRASLEQKLGMVLAEMERQAHLAAERAAERRREEEERERVEMIGWACMVNALTMARHRSADGLLEAA